MIDTVKVWVECAPDFDYLAPVLDSPRIQEDLASGHQTLSGYLDNLYIKAEAHGLRISGSLNRYWKDTNAVDCTREELEKAVDKLGRILGVPVQEGIVWRLDVASTLVMDMPPSSYITLCEEARATGIFQKVKYTGESVAFMNGWQTVQIYDKGVEMRHRKETPPIKLKGKHLLRCEVQFKKRPFRQFKERITLGKLCSPEFFGKVVDRWEAELLAIRMRKNRRLLRAASTKELEGELMLDGLEHRGGLNVYFQDLSTAYQERMLGYQIYYRHREKIRVLAGSKRLTVDSDAATEFRAKVQLAAQYHRYA